MTHIKDPAQITQFNEPKNGLGIAKTAQLLREYIAIEKARLHILAGWFLKIGSYDYKYKLSYHLYDASEHITWMLGRLKDMRGGNPKASVRPELLQILKDALHAPNDIEFLSGFYGVLSQQFLESLAKNVALLDPSANANETRILKRMKANLEEQIDWYSSLNLQTEDSPWAHGLNEKLASIGGLNGETPSNYNSEQTFERTFQRPTTILFDETITVGSLTSYEDRVQMDAKQATIEQFKVFFNEFYAAALLASILFDAHDGDYPWEFFEDFSRHFWDEARHSEFGAIRLKELGVEPSRVNPVLFEESQGLPILHRVAYLTRGLEAYFMPRKPKRMKEYLKSGDTRSQLFADQDWSDEINHVRYGTRWTEYLLDNDYREVDDVIEEVKEHLSTLRGEPVNSINAPF